MQLYSPISHQQLSEHLCALRQEAALIRLVPRQLGLFARLKRLFVRSAGPVRQPGARIV